MADFCDDASYMESLARQVALTNAGMKKPAAPSRETCAECGAAIPEARRIAVPGVELCVRCQAEQEG